VFTRTKQATEELAEKLKARGFSAAAINGDIVQAQRERAIQQLKDGKLDILVATDVAARGLDVERISHVLNYDIPYDTEAYVHRIGRTGRAGRSGEAILFVTPREKRLLQTIERATRQPIAEMQLPSVDAVNDRRMSKFKQRIGETLAGGDLGVFQQLIEQYQSEHNVPAVEIAAALARMAQGDAPLLLKTPERTERAHSPREFERGERERGERGFERREREPARRSPTRRDEADASSSFRRLRAERANSEAGPKGEREARVKPEPSFSAEPKKDLDPGAPRFPTTRPPMAAPRVHRNESESPRAAARPSHGDREERPSREHKHRDGPDAGFETFRIEVGHAHGVKPGNIVGAIANEAGLDSKHIGRVDIREDHSFVDLPEGMPSDVFKILKKVWVSGQQLRITRGSGEAPESRDKFQAPKRFKPRPAAAAGFAKPKHPKSAKPRK
jgi:ATP-dependent RNA helicase DeaD